MVLEPAKKPPSVPTREELYNLCFFYLVAAAASLICWAGFDIINRILFHSTIPIDNQVKPAFLIAFVFFLGMAIAFYSKARTTLFLSPEKDLKIVLGADTDPNRKFIEDAFRKLDDHNKEENKSKERGVDEA